MHNHDSNQYADGKPRPILRGFLHGCSTPVYLMASSLALLHHHRFLSFGLASKAITYGVSGIFHLKNFRNPQTLTNAFIMDLICVPFSLVGSVAPFLQAASDKIIAREVFFAGVVLIGNTLLVLKQTKGQIGLKTNNNQSDTPRTILVGLYSSWVSVFIGIQTSHSYLWFMMTLQLCVAAMISVPVTNSHEKEPLSPHVPWHVPGLWSFHEDFHLVLSASDAIWLCLSLQFLP